MKVAKLTFALVLVSLMAGLALAQNTDQPNGGARRGGRGGPGGFGGGDVAAAFERLSSAVQKLDLTSEQKEKFEALKKEYAPKVKAIHEKADKIFTDEQRTAIKTAREAKPEDRRAAFQKLRDTLKLTDDQKKQLEPVAKEGRTLLEEVRTKVANTLTDEQKTKLREAMNRGGRRGNGPGRGGNGGGNGDQSQRST